MRGADVGRRSDRGAIVILLVVSFALWVLGAWLRGGRSVFEHDVIDQQTLQAQAWLEGRLDLGRSPRYLEIAEYGGKYFNSFPPTPAVLEVPLVALLGRETPNSLVLYGFVFLALAALFRMLRRRGWSQREAAVAALAFVFGTNLYVSCVKANVWAQGQALGFAFAVLGLGLVVDNTRRGLRGPTMGYLLLSLAVGCRPFYAFMAPLFVVLDWRTSRPNLRRVLLSAVAGMAPYGLLLATFNWARFRSPFEFGHTYLPWARTLQNGLFHWRYLPRNAYHAFARLPDLSTEPPFLAFDPYGTAFWLNNGVLLLAFVALVRVRFDPVVRTAAATALLGIATGLLCYASSGWRQFGYRFFIDLLPAAFAVFLYAYRRWTWLLTAAFASALALNLYGLVVTKTLTRELGPGWVDVSSLPVGLGEAKRGQPNQGMTVPVKQPSMF